MSTVLRHAKAVLRHAKPVVAAMALAALKRGGEMLAEFAAEAATKKKLT